MFIAFGHSILAMSGEETLAQVYREVESPKLLNFKKAAFIVFVYSIVLTAGISFLAVLLIPAGRPHGQVLRQPARRPGDERHRAGLGAAGPQRLRGRGRRPDPGGGGQHRHHRLQRRPQPRRRGRRHAGMVPQAAPAIRHDLPHPLSSSSDLQLFTIFVSRGDVLLLGEAYAFGVVWSFVFQALAMVVLRFKDPRPREAKVPLNVRIGKYEVPDRADVDPGGTADLGRRQPAHQGDGHHRRAGLHGVFFGIFWVSEHYYERPPQGRKAHAHGAVQPGDGGGDHAGRPGPEQALPQAGVDPLGPQPVHAGARLGGNGPDDHRHGGDDGQDGPGRRRALRTRRDLDAYDQKLMTAVVDRAEKAGKQVKPLIVPTNNPLHAVLKTAMDLQAQELIMGASNKYTVDEQLEQIAFYWINLHGGNPAPLTVRILSRERDVYLDIAGGSRIPKISERSARSVAELRAAGVGVDRVIAVARRQLGQQRPVPGRCVPCSIRW